MKTLILFILALGLVAGAFYVYKIPYSKCDTPIAYKLGSIDPRFKLNEKDALARINEGAVILGRKYGKPLFEYSNAEDSLTINFLYDQRTELERGIEKMRGEVDTENEFLSERIKDYEADVAAFEKILNDYNSRVQKYNSLGGAPPEAYDQLTKERDRLQTQGNALNARAKVLNLETNNFNTSVDDLNKNVNKFNTAIVEKPEEGLFDPEENTISIYFVDDKDELVHTLAHEFGHALGMLHVEDPKALMYPNSSKTLALAAGDIAELDIVCQSYPTPVHWQYLLMEKLYKLSQNSVLVK